MCSHKGNKTFNKEVYGNSQRSSVGARKKEGGAPSS